MEYLYLYLETRFGETLSLGSDTLGGLVSFVGFAVVVVVVVVTTSVVGMVLVVAASVVVVVVIVTASVVVLLVVAAASVVVLFTFSVLSSSATLIKRGASLTVNLALSKEFVKSSRLVR